MKGQSLEERIQKVVAETAQVIAEMVRADLADEVQQAIAKRSNGHRSDGARRALARAKNASPRRLPAHCIFPGCNRPHKGPRFSFLCDEHMGVSKSDRAKYLREWKTEHTTPPKNGASKRKASTRKSGRLDEATVSRVLKVVEDSPGLRSEQIYEKLTLPPALTKRALAKLREDRRVKTKGERRAMTYALA